MAEVHPLPEQRREFITDGDRSALRATWHNDAGYVVISLWHGDTCVATSHLTPIEAGRLATFVTGGLADLAHQQMISASTVTRIPAPLAWRDHFLISVSSWRGSVAGSLERIAHRLRSSR